VRFLNARSIAGSGTQADVGQLRQATASLAGHGHGEGAEIARSLQRGTDVVAGSRSRDADYDIARSAKSIQLALEDFRESTVVGDGGQHGAVCSECERRQGPTVAAKASHEFGRQMLRVGGTAAVTAPENLVALPHAFGHETGGTVEGLLLGVKLGDEVEVLPDGDVENFGQVRRDSHALLVHDELRIFPEPCWRVLLFEIIVAMLSGAVGNSENIRYVFLDRDGVLNRHLPGGYVSSWEQCEILPGVAEAVARLNRSGRKVIVVTNQRGIALGLYSEADLYVLHERMRVHLAGHGAYLDAIYYCPHNHGECQCRKPETGMFEQAFEDFPGATAGNSVMVGDSASDIEAASRLGMRSVFISDPAAAPRSDKARAASLATVRAASLLEFVKTCLGS